VKHGTLIAVELPCGGLLGTFRAQGAIAAGAEELCHPVRMIFALHLYASLG